MEAQFFGTYVDNTTNFVFSDIDRLLIERLSDHCKQIMEEGLDKAIASFESITVNTAANDWYFDDKTYSIANHSIDQPVVIAEEESFIYESEKISQTRHILNRLQSTLNENAYRPKEGWRFNEDIRNWASYLRMRAGPLAYNDLQRNFEGILPSLSTTNRYIKRTSTSVIEGVARYHELKIYLEERNLPLFVSLSEDATRIEGRVQFDSSTNQLIGFTLPRDVNGMPKPLTFKASSVEKIIEHFISNNPTVTYVFTIMAQPLAKVPPFCLLIFGSTNKYTAESVARRWVHVTNELAKENITVLTISSDSDPRYNSAMRRNCLIGKQSKNVLNFDWFSCASELSIPFYVQDIIHIATKMRNFVINAHSRGKILLFGKKSVIDVNHLQYLVDNFPKDQHQLTEAILKPIDRQNFMSVLRICDERVIELLKKHVSNSEGTVMYLQIMKNFNDAFLDLSLTPVQRINKVWYSIFIVRIWRKYVSKQTSITLKENFISSNCYSCLEINAHSLILILLFLKQKNAPNLFTPQCFNSQPCEEFYRLLRSFTSTYSTKINCSVKEALGRIHKIQLQSDISNTKSEVKYPHKLREWPINKFDLPTELEIIEQIEKCKSAAVKDAITLGLLSRAEKKLPITCAVIPFTPKRLKIIFNESDESYESDGSYEDEEFEKESELEFQIRNVLSGLRFTTLKNFEKKFIGKEVDVDGPFVEILGKNKRIVLKKTSLCWLLGKPTHKLSSDRLKRVKCNEKNGKKQRKTPIQQPVKSFKIMKHVKRKY